MEDKFKVYKASKVKELIIKIVTQLSNLEEHLITYYYDWYLKTIDDYDSGRESDESLIIKLEYIYDCMSWENTGGS